MGTKGGREASAVLVSFLLLSIPAARAVPAVPAPRADQTIADLQSTDADRRSKAVQALKDAGDPEAAAPLAPLVGDPEDAIQLDAIAAELNIFLTEKIVTRRRVGFVIERRSALAAETAFASGRLALAPQPVPRAVLDALRAAIRDDNPRVGLEALYAFGTLASIPSGSERRELLRASGPELTALVGSPDPAVRVGALRVMERVFALRPGDPPIDPTVGDGLIVALNDRDRVVKAAAMHALGAMRYGRAIAALTELFSYHEKGGEAEAALDAIARIANPSSAALLTAQLASKAPALRGIAVEGLARVGGAGRLAEIQAALKAERTEAVVLAGDFAAVLLAGAAIDPIVDAVMKPRLRDQARSYLVEIAPGRTALFRQHVGGADARVRVEAADALGLSGDSSALTLVEPLVGDSDTTVARAAELAVGRLRTSAAKPVS